MSNLVPVEVIENRIYLIQGQKVMLDADLAELYGVKTKSLNKAVKRNFKRFPKDFMFQLNGKEARNLRFHFGTSKRGGRRYLPYVFTEQGIAMLSSVLNSDRSIYVNIIIMRTFVRLRQVIASNKKIAQKLKELENKFEKRYHKHDKEIGLIFETIEKLLNPPNHKPKKIGFI
ncbi:MAG: ORF6N domain-containing protein [Candidatus Margulisbacteria bacterium]|nr:ORF6N domain-containing protein [Candidatus Margulisiibacteriota bacterium]MBU1022415.1 ORF6N domain-containing protein [Candidatus Margulisiibacteriota bacterium]MBU1729033.1 ORF6N domain-containing protein [Candidatus Margulisiibacteriota bacterium]MBU1954546.1 ORF6N domain-containing protein [Candidatus Margulisiibacteriota bacterium]